MNLERREIRLIETKAEATPGRFSGYGAIFGNEDAQGDVIRAGAFTETLSRWQKERGKFPPMLLQHGGGAFTQNAEDLLPIGVWDGMEENRRGLKVEGQLFALGTEKGQYIYEGLKSGALDGLSIGYQTKEFIAGTRAGEPDRILTAVDLWEVSIVTFPANPAARVASVKAITHESQRELEDALRDAGLSREACRRAMPIFRKWLRPEAGESSGPREAAAADDQLAELLSALRNQEERITAEALTGYLTTFGRSF
jgi:HK97 family phage prohead protease